MTIKETIHPLIGEASTLTSTPLTSPFSRLLSKGASWRSTKNVGDTTVHTLSNIRYGNDSPSQSLDIYFPDEFVPQNASLQDSLGVTSGEPPPSSSTSSSSLRPVYIHIHGGGWSRGSKTSPFYGGPAISHTATTSCGCIAVTPGYRLGSYPEFMHDCALSIQWVKVNITQLGGDIHNVFLSGHSAGGHIASLLILRHASFLAPVGIPRDFFRGLILVSGVYDLFSPMKKYMLDAKNKWFLWMYVNPAFGTHEQTKREASPLLLLEPDKDCSVLGHAEKLITERLLRRVESFRTRNKSCDDMDEDEDEVVKRDVSMVSTGGIVQRAKSLIITRMRRRSMQSFVDDSSEKLDVSGEDVSTSEEAASIQQKPSSKESEAPNTVNDSNKPNTSTEDIPTSSEAATNDNTTINPNPSSSTKQSQDPIANKHDNNNIEINTTNLPATLILNASYDMGLQENGKLMCSAMEKHGADVTYALIAGADHASICWNEQTSKAIKDFIERHRCDDGSASGSSRLVDKQNEDDDALPKEEEEDVLIETTTGKS